MVAAGGAIGAVLRYAIVLVFKSWQFDFPYHTLFANMLGCFLIGFFMNQIFSSANFESYRMFLIIGVLGAFTTFSTFSYEFLAMLQQKQLIQAIGYVLITNITCLLAVISGNMMVSK